MYLYVFDRTWTPVEKNYYFKSFAERNLRAIILAFFVGLSEFPYTNVSSSILVWYYVPYITDRSFENGCGASTKI